MLFICNNFIVVDNFNYVQPNDLNLVSFLEYYHFINSSTFIALHNACPNINFLTGQQ